MAETKKPCEHHWKNWLETVEVELQNGDIVPISIVLRFCDICGERNQVQLF